MMVVNIMVESNEANYFTQSNMMLVDCLKLKQPPTGSEDTQREQLFSSLKKEVAKGTMNTLGFIQSQNTTQLTRILFNKDTFTSLPIPEQNVLLAKLGLQGSSPYGNRTTFTNYINKNDVEVTGNGK
jgi:hypothetical protein